MPVAAQLGSKQEEILHYGGVRMRVTGSGFLDMSFLSLDEVEVKALVPFTMSATTAREPTRLANFISQRAMLKISTDTINESFKVNRIIIFAKPLWSNFPG